MYLIQWIWIQRWSKCSYPRFCFKHYLKTENTKKNREREREREKERVMRILAKTEGMIQDVAFNGLVSREDWWYRLKYRLFFVEVIKKKSLLGSKKEKKYSWEYI